MTEKIKTSAFTPHKDYKMLLKQTKALNTMVECNKRATSILMHSNEIGYTVVSDCVSALEEQSNLNSVQNEVLDEAKQYLLTFAELHLNSGEIK